MTNETMLVAAVCQLMGDRAGCGEALPVKCCISGLGAQVQVHIVRGELVLVFVTLERVTDLH